MSAATPLPLTWKAGQVAVALGLRSTEAFQKVRTELEQSFGFPTKLPGLNAWSIAAVTHWVRTNGGRQSAVVTEVTSTPPDLAGVVVALEGRYGRGKVAA